MKFHPIAGDSFLLGLWASGGLSEWSWQLDLLHHMMAIGKVDTKRVGEEIVCILPANNEEE